MDGQGEGRWHRLVCPSRGGGVEYRWVCGGEGSWGAHTDKVMRLVRALKVRDLKGTGMHMGDEA